MTRTKKPVAGIPTELAGILEACKTDETAWFALVDWLEEHGYHRMVAAIRWQDKYRTTRTQKMSRARDDSARTEETFKAIALHKALSVVDLAAIVANDLFRHAPRTEQAKAARDLFKRLGLPFISVTAPSYSMASSVDVRLPQRSDYLDRDPDSCVSRDDEARQANCAAFDTIGDILAMAFPNHGDRSDSQSDHFDYKWSIYS